MAVTTYFMYAPDLMRVKIGKTERMHERILEVSRCSPCKVILLGTIDGDHEKIIHNKFKSQRVKGEWFNVTSDILEFLKDNIKCDQVTLPGMDIDEISDVPPVDEMLIPKSIVPSPIPEFLLPIREAGKRIGKSREFVRRMGEAGAVTLHKTGGTDARPWLAVNPDELEAAYRAFTVYRPAVTRPSQPYPSPSPSREPSHLRGRPTVCSDSGTLHPAIADMRKLHDARVARK